VPNLYADVAMFTRRYVHDSALTASDAAEVLRVLNDSARRVDDYLGRHFFTELATRYYDGNSKHRLWLPDDLLSVTTLKVDDDGDGVFETELVADTDYWLWPDNSTPKIRIDINPESNLISRWPTGRRRIEVVGEWGYTNAVEREAATATVADASTTVLTSSVAGGLAIGQTLLLGTEQVYVSAGAGTAWTITRGVNGTTAAAHIAGTVIDRYVYEEAAVGAALMWAGRLWTRKDTADATTIINPMMGTLEVHRGMDPDIRQALDRYRAPVLV